jgi:hypothetical protein
LNKPPQTLKIIALKKKYYNHNKTIKRGHMETNSQKPKEWVGIINEPNFIIAFVHVRV